jgi:hypothetical protein
MYQFCRHSVVSYLPAKNAGSRTPYVGELRDDVFGLIVIVKAVSSTPFQDLFLGRLDLLKLPRRKLAL